MNEPIDPTPADKFIRYMQEHNRQIMIELDHLLNGNYSPTPISWDRVQRALCESRATRHVHIFMLLGEAYGMKQPKIAAAYNELTAIQKSSLSNGIIHILKAHACL